MMPVVPIIGAGPAGMSCALWLRNYELRPILIEREAAPGGMARQSPYPNEWLLGRPHETARENALAFERHLREVAVELRLGTSPRELDRERDGSFRIELAFSSGFGAPESLTAATLVLAMGTRFHGEEWLDQVANARRVLERGRLHVGAPWAGEPNVDPGSHVAIVGGGDNAFDVARMLVERGVRVTIVMRSRAPRARPALVERLRGHPPEMARVWRQRSVRSVEDCNGGVRLNLDNGERFEADHVLLLLGYRPNGDAPWMAKLGLARDGRGYIVVDRNMETSCPGVFAVGDVGNPAHPSIAVAIASGAVAAREIARRLAR